MTGAVASQNVTEARKGPLRTVGNRSQSARVQAGLTARPTSRAEDVYKRQGKDGAISVEESQTFGIDMDIVEGMQYERGYKMCIRDRG